MAKFFYEGNLNQFSDYRTRNGIDGFYSHSAFEMYHTMAVLNPRKPADVLKQISDEKLSMLIGDNPAGQDDEQTPFIVVRKIFGNLGVEWLS